MPDPKLSTPNKATVVATTIGHKPYTRHQDTISGEPTTTSRALANDRPVTRTSCLFDE